MSLVESGKSILIQVCKLCTNEKKKVFDMIPTGYDFTYIQWNTSEMKVS